MNNQYHELLNKQANGTISPAESVLLHKTWVIMAREDFQLFCTLIHAKRGYKWMWFHKYMQSRLQAKVDPKTEYDRTHERLLMRIGDQHTKTTNIMLFICWCLGKFPNKQCMYLTFDKERAKEITPEIVTILIDPVYKEIFPDFMLPDEMFDVEREAEKSTQRMTNLTITNAGSPKTGKQGKLVLGGIADVLGLSGDIIICDDLLSGVTEAVSEKIRETKWRIFASGVLSRQQKGTIVIVTGTWWHREDIIGRIQNIFIDNEDKLETGTKLWELVEFNSQKDERDYHYDHRKIGEYLWPEERMHVYLDQKQTSPLDWQIKHQNIPLDVDGVLFKVTSFRVYDYLPVDVNDMMVIISMDSNYKTKDTSDCAGITVWGIHQMKAYLIEFNNTSRFSTPQAMDELVKLTQKYPKYHAILVELHSQGQPIMDLAPMWQLTRVEGFVPQGQGKKWERAQRVLPIFDAGQIYIPNDKNYASINIFTNQFLTFNGEDGRKDDLVDSATQMLLHYDYLFRGSPAQIPRVIKTQDILAGNMKRLMGNNSRILRRY